jgi:regulator of sirC expression with transglutaminase-like and TPR domain
VSQTSARIREAMSSQPSINTRQFLETLVGQTVFTIDRGDWNRVDRLDGSDVVVQRASRPVARAYRSR